MPKERSYDYFWNSNSDRYYDADSMADWLKPFFSNGVFNGQLQVVANDNMSVTVTTGYGYINGKHKHFINETTLDLETASGNLDRIDSVFLRRNDTERSFYFVVETGGNARNPVAPVPTRRGAIYDLKLAEIYIAAGTVKITQAEITDTRMDPDVCGWVAATVEQIDFGQIKEQFDSFFTAYKEKTKNDIDNFMEMLEAYQAEQKEQFEAWEESVKSILDENTAGNLLSLIEGCQNTLNTHKGDSTIHVTEEKQAAWDGKMETDGDSAENTVTFESGDVADPAVWADVELMQSGEKHKSLFRKISLIARNSKFLKKMLEKLNTDLSTKVSDTDPRLSDSRPPTAHNHDDRYFTETEINNTLSGLGPINPKNSKVQAGSTQITLATGNTMTYKTISIDKDIYQFMPFLIYSDSCFNCPVFMSSAVSGKNATIYLIPKNTPGTYYSYTIWYYIVSAK